MFLAPLYPKVYLEADAARKLSTSFIKQFKKLNIFSESSIVLKTFLTSSRSYKEYISLDSEIDPIVCELLMSTSLPKFIWVTELSNQELLKQQKAYGVMLIDATEPKIETLVAALFNNVYISLGISKIQLITVALQPFNIFSNNLKH